MMFQVRQVRNIHALFQNYCAKHVKLQTCSSSIHRLRLCNGNLQRAPLALVSRGVRQDCRREFGYESSFCGNKLHKNERRLCSYTADDPQNCYHDEFVQLMKDGKVTTIDVRRVDEIQETGMMDGAHNIPLDELKQALELPDDKFEKRYGLPKPEPEGSELIFTCRSGVRSLNALQIAQGLGFRKARHYPGGWLEWAEKGR